MTPGPLTDADCEAAFRGMIDAWFLERLDTRLGTASVVPLVKALGACFTSGPCEDGPYSDGENEEWWSRVVSRCGKGYDVAVVRHVRSTGEETVVRAGVVPWNNLANRATIAACRLRYPDYLAVDPQLALFV